LSHAAIRSLVMELGGVGLLYTEMLATKRLPSDNPSCSPLLVRREGEDPLFYQIITSDISSIVPALEKLHRLGADGVDLNLGCPAPIMKKQGAGSSLSENPSLLGRALKEIRVNTTLPFSVKLRLGPTGDVTHLQEQCRIFEGEGVDLITIHARLNDEKFCRRPRWSVIRDVVEKLTVPVFANGGIFSVEDAEKCLNESGADGLMLGRGAVEKPWLGRLIAEKIYGLPISYDRSLTELFFRFAEKICDRFRAERRLGRLKQFTEYYSANFQFGHHLRSAVQSSSSMEEALEKATMFFELNHPSTRINSCLKEV